MAIAACLLFAPSTVEGPVFAALAIVTGFLLFYYRPRSAGGSDSASPAHAGQVELITMRQLDERTLLRGGSKCECGFIKVSWRCAYIGENKYIIVQRFDMFMRICGRT